jgi:hypothetical protein
VDGVQGSRPRQAGERFRAGEHERRQQHEPDGEEHDLAARRAAHREELRVASQQVKERLREREGAQDRELERPAPEAIAQSRTHAAAGRPRTWARERIPAPSQDRVSDDRSCS